MEKKRICCIPHHFVFLINNAEVTEKETTMMRTKEKGKEKTKKKKDAKEEGEEDELLLSFSHQFMLRFVIVSDVKEVIILLLSP